jgi:hypothetical protein
MKMKQRVGRTNRFLLGFFSWLNHSQGIDRGQGELGDGPDDSRFVAKWTVQIDQQQERMVQDKLNNIHIKPTICALIQCYNMVIISD